MSLKNGLKAVKQKRYSEGIFLLEEYCQNSSQQDTEEYGQAQIGLIKVYRGDRQWQKAISLCQELTNSADPLIKSWAEQTLPSLLRADRQSPKATSQPERKLSQAGRVAQTGVKLAMQGMAGSLALASGVTISLLLGMVLVLSATVRRRSAASRTPGLMRWPTSGPRKIPAKIIPIRGGIRKRRAIRLAKKPTNKIQIALLSIISPNSTSQRLTYKMQQNLKDKVKQGLYLIPALRLVWGAAPNWTAARLILLLTQGLLPIASLYLTKLIIDGISTSFPTANTANINNPITTFQELIPLLLLAGAIALLGMMLTSLAEVVNTAQSEKVTNFMRDLLHGKSIEVDLEYYENPQYHDTLQRAQQEVSFRPNGILTLLAEVLQNGIALVALTGLLFSLYWGVAAVLFVATLPRAFVRVKYARVLYQWQRKRTALQRQARYLSLLLTGEMFAQEVRLFDLGALFRSRFRNLQKKIYQERLAIATKQAIINFSTQVLGSGFLLAASGYIVYQAIQGAITLGDLALYYQAMQRGQNSLKQFLISLSGLYENNLFLKNLYEFLELKPKVLEPKNTRVLPQVLRRGIVFDRVSFHYPNTLRQALHEINLRVAPGETIALVGENGSGKTTLIKLLCRLYDPTAGNIYLEGVNIRDFSVSDLRRQISIIFQNYAKYNFSAQDNIGLGNIDLLPNLNEIEAAARRSGADAVIRQLPQEYETILGKLFKQGEELSIGQWQKIALARAFLRSSQIIVLDEPTSAMDPKAEYEVFQQFRQLIQNTAAILISHRMSTVRIADRIYVMEQGRIVEWGTHSELIEKGDIYAQMFETQAGNYR